MAETATVKIVRAPKGKGMHFPWRVVLENGRGEIVKSLKYFRCHQDAREWMAKQRQEAA